jgi:hypothetical protein
MNTPTPPKSLEQASQLNESEFLSELIDLLSRSVKTKKPSIVEDWHGFIGELNAGILRKL